MAWSEMFQAKNRTHGTPDFGHVKGTSQAWRLS